MSKDESLVCIGQQQLRNHLSHWCRQNGCRLACYLFRQPTRSKKTFNWLDPFSVLGRDTHLFWSNSSWSHIADDWRFNRARRSKSNVLGYLIVSQMRNDAWKARTQHLPDVCIENASLFKFTFTIALLLIWHFLCLEIAEPRTIHFQLPQSTCRTMQDPQVFQARQNPRKPLVEMQPNLFVELLVQSSFHF